MPFTADGQWRDFFPYQTRQYVLAHHTPIAGLPFTVVPDSAAFRIVRNIVRDLGERGCWGYGTQRKGHPSITFIDPAGVKQKIRGHRFALLLRDDEPIPPGNTANHATGCPWWCINPRHVYRGTQSENMLDAYLDGRRTYSANVRLDFDNAYERLQADRIARQSQEIRCQRFFCDEIRAELAPATLRPGLAAAT